MNRRPLRNWSVAALALLGLSACEDHNKEFALDARAAVAGGSTTLPEVARLTMAARANPWPMAPGLHFTADSATVRATAVLNPTEGHQAAGQIAFLQQGTHTHIIGFIGHLTPGLHGLHVHEVGDCSTPDASSAGEHFSAQPGHPHGAPSDPPNQRHAGDLGNIEADANGVAEIAIENSELILSGKSGALGRALVVHALPDDLESQPAGNSGDRIACGVILRSDSLAMGLSM